MNWEKAREVALKVASPIIKLIEKRRQIRQSVKNGRGPVYHIKYFVEFNNPKISPLLLIKKIQKNPNLCVDKSKISFEKTHGDADNLEIGDEYLIHVPGPWAGQVIVKSVTKNGFIYDTNEKVTDNSEIKFRVEETRPNMWRFTIESFAKSRELGQDMTFERLNLSRFIKADMWVEFCKQFARFTEPERQGKLRVITEKNEKGEWITL